MTEIEFSAIVELPEEIQALKELLNQFQERYGTSVKLRLLNWENAWSELLSYALYGKEPDVSHIGSTWCSSLVEMNALRVLRSMEVAQLGNRDAFLRPAWLSAMVEGDARIWSIPWTGYTNVLAYRLDLFMNAGLSDSSQLENYEGMSLAIQQLKKSGVNLPFVLPTTGNVDLLHAAASWVWEAGGDFIDPINKKVLFTESPCVNGLRNFFELFRLLPSPVPVYTVTQCADLLASGSAAISLVNTKSLLGILRQNLVDEVTKNIGAAAISQTPWFGGGNLVIWKHTQYSVEKEHAAFNLVRFLTSLASQEEFTKKADELPVTADAFQRVFPNSHPLSPALQRAILHGKPYRATQLWGRVERLLGQVLENVASEVRDDPNRDLEAVLSRYLDPLARRLEMTLATS